MYCVSRLRVFNIASLIRMLFISYFLVYAVSPLSCAINSQGDCNVYSSGGTASHSGNLHIFVWEFIFSKLAWEDGPDNNPGDGMVTVLLRKSRAIVPENLTARIIFSQIVMGVADSVSTGAIVSSEHLAEDEEQTHPCTVNPLYSGHSPPASDLPS